MHTVEITTIKATIPFALTRNVSIACLINGLLARARIILFVTILSSCIAYADRDRIEDEVALVGSRANNTRGALA